MIVANIVLVFGYFLILFYSISNMVVALTIYRVMKNDFTSQDIQSYWEKDGFIQLFGLFVGYFEEGYSKLLLSKQFTKILIYTSMFISTYFLLIVFSATEVNKTVILNQPYQVYIRIFLLAMSIILLLWAFAISNNIYRYKQKQHEEI